jgi:hypothetical protein
MDADGRPAGVGLPSAAFSLGTRVKRDPEQAGPESPRPLGIIGGKFDQ